MTVDANSLIWTRVEKSDFHISPKSSIFPTQISKQVLLRYVLFLECCFCNLNFGPCISCRVLVLELTGSGKSTLGHVTKDIRNLSWKNITILGMIRSASICYKTHVLEGNFIICFESLHVRLPLGHCEWLQAHF